MTATISPPPTTGRAPQPAPAPRMPGVLVPATATGVAVMLAALALSPVYASGAWIGATLLTVVAVVTAGGVATWLRAPVFLVPVIQAGVMFAALVSRFTSDAPLGFVPSSDALDQLRSVLAAGLSDVDKYSPPVPVTEGDTAVAALGLGCLAIVVFVLQVSLRMPVIAGAALLAVYVVPALVLDDGAPWWSFAFVAIGFMVLLVSDERVGLASWGRMLRRSEGNAGSPLAGFSSAALRLGAIAVAAAVAIPILVPALTDAVLGRHDTGYGNGKDSGTGGDPQASVGLNPFVSVRKSLREPLSQQVVFTYTVDKPDYEPDYLRAVVLTSYTAETWSPVSFKPDNGVSIDDGVPPDPALGASVVQSAPKVQTTVTDRGLKLGFLPVPSHLVGLTIIDGGGSWFVDNQTRTVFAGDEGTTTSDATWRATSLALQPSEAELRAAPPTNDQDPTTKAQRAAIPDSIRQLALEWTQGATTDYDKARAIEQRFHQDFSYSLAGTADDSPDAPTYLDQFLQSRSGYCQQFAATMALMAESLGIRARVVVGYTAGSRQPDGTWVVRGSDAHAWPELYFQGIGWQRFEPTPSVGNVQGPPIPTGAAAGGPSSTSTASASSSVSIKPIPDEKSAGGPIDLSAGTSTSADTWRLRGLVALVVLGGLLALVPAAWRAVRRRRRLSEQAQIEDMWEELRDTARDLGIPWSMAQTPRQAVRSLSEHEHLRGEARDALVRVGRATERSRYAATPPPTEGLSDDVLTVRSALLHRADRGVRWRALLLPASLRDRDR